MRLYSVGDVRWTFRLPIYSSARRLAVEGPFTVSLRYTINYIWVLFFKKPFTQKFADIRLKVGNRKLYIKPRDSFHELLSGAFVIIVLFFSPVAVTVLVLYILNLMIKSISE